MAKEKTPGYIRTGDVKEFFGGDMEKATEAIATIFNTAIELTNNNGVGAVVIVSYALGLLVAEGCKNLPGTVESFESIISDRAAIAIEGYNRFNLD